MRYVLVLMTVMALVVLATNGHSPKSAVAAPITFELRGLGQNEVPPCDSPGTTFGRFTFDEATRELTWAITVSGLSPNQVTGSHFHRGAAGTNGPIVYRFEDAPFTQSSGRLPIAAEDVELLKAGGFYWNTHSQTCPGGFARAQVIIPGAAAAPAPGPAQITAPSTGDGGLLSSEANNNVLAAILPVAVVLFAVLILARRSA